MPSNTLIVLAEVSFQFGLIGLDEYVERCEVARWLDDDSNESADPREPASDSAASDEASCPATDVSSAAPASPSSCAPYDPGIVRFVFRKKWLFTIADRDCYPSTPHGHFQSATSSWPKLNPYTGRAFRQKHQEEPSMRLDKSQMRELWREEGFREFCRNHVLWYMESFPHHRFPTVHPLRFPRW